MLHKAAVAVHFLSAAVVSMQGVRFAVATGRCTIFMRGPVGHMLAAMPAMAVARCTLLQNER